MAARRAAHRTEPRPLTVLYARRDGVDCAGGGWVGFGANAYLTVLILGASGRLGWADTPASLQTNWVLGAAGARSSIEFVVDKIPLLDSVWDLVHTFIRPVIGGLDGRGDRCRAAGRPAGFALAAGLALIGHLTKTTSRLAINMSPEPFTNVIASFAEDGVVSALVALAMAYPRIAAISRDCRRSRRRDHRDSCCGSSLAVGCGGSGRGWTADSGGAKQPLTGRTRPEAVEATMGIEPMWTALQAVASATRPRRHAFPGCPDHGACTIAAAADISQVVPGSRRVPTSHLDPGHGRLAECSHDALRYRSPPSSSSLPAATTPRRLRRPRPPARHRRLRHRRDDTSHRRSHHVRSSDDHHRRHRRAGDGVQRVRRLPGGRHHAAAGRGPEGRRSGTRRSRAPPAPRRTTCATSSAKAIRAVLTGDAPSTVTLPGRPRRRRRRRRVPGGACSATAPPACECRARSSPPTSPAGA